MAVNKRSKRSRARGSWTHGGGHKKKRRGAGSRGGRGRGGFGKRGQQRMPTAQLRKEVLGKQGFYRHGQKNKIKKINFDEINLMLEKGTIKEGETLDLGKLGYNKLLGSGNLNKKLKIKVDAASKKAEEKVKKTGGEIIGFETEKEETNAESEAKEEQ